MLPVFLHQARTELLALIGQLYASLRSRFDSEDTATVFVWVEVRRASCWGRDLVSLALAALLPFSFSQHVCPAPLLLHTEVQPQPVVG